MQGQADYEDRPFACLCMEIDRPAMFVHYHRARYREALSCALADAFGCEEGLEDFAPSMVWDTRAGVADSDLHPIPIAPCAGGNLSLGRFIPFDGIADGVGCVDHKIQDHLVEFSRKT